MVATPPRFRSLQVAALRLQSCVCTIARPGYSVIKGNAVYSRTSRTSIDGPLGILCVIVLVPGSSSPYSSL